MNHIKSFFLDVHMGRQHQGLYEIAKKGRVDLTKLKAGEFVLFANTDFNAFKLFGAGNVFLYFRNTKNRRLHPRALATMVRCFDGVSFDYKKALQDTILKQLGPDMQAYFERKEKKK